MTAARRAARAVALVATLACTPREARAQRPTFWDEARAPGVRAVQHALFEARLNVHLADGLTTRRSLLYAQIQATPAGPERDDLLREFRRLRAQASDHEAHAIEQYRGVLARDPRHATALAELADLLDQGSRPEALALRERARGIFESAPVTEPLTYGHVLFDLGVEYTRRLRFADARDAYEAQVRLPLGSERIGIGLCNLAETYVYLHDLPRSIETYRACIAALPDRATGWWGIALAYDRDARDVESAEAAQNARLIDPDLGDIVSDQVFYVPEYERFYYLGIAYEAQGHEPEAFKQWVQYLAAGGPTDPWAARAVFHRDRLALRLRAVRTAAPSSGAIRRR